MAPDVNQQGQDGWIAAEEWSDDINRRGIDANVRAKPQMREYMSIADRIARDHPSRLLDWGCGWGQMTDLLARRGVDVEAFDVDPQLREAARRELPRYPGLTALVSPDERRLPYEHARFDAALSCGVLEHVVDPDASLRELARVLRPGGTLYVYKLPNRFSYLERIAKMLGLYYHGRLENDRLYTPRRARELLERNGYEVLELRHANMLPLSLTGRVASRAALRIWQANRVLSGVPGIQVLATNVELIARSRA